MSETPDTTSGRKFGRPPKPRDEVRSERVVSFLTRGEFESLTRLAADSGESLSSVIHRILSAGLVEAK